MAETLTLDLPAETAAKLERLGRATDRSAAQVAEEAIDAFVAQELSIIEMVEAGTADMKAGNVVGHDAVVRRIRSGLDGRSGSR